MIATLGGWGIGQCGNDKVIEQRSAARSFLGRVFWIIVLVCVAFPGPLLADDDSDDNDARLVGTWRVTILPGIPVEFFGLTVFNQGGTATNRGSDTLAVSDSNGVWKRIRGRGRFAATFEGFSDISADGMFDQRFQVCLTIQLLEDDTLTGTFTLEFLTLDGAILVVGPFTGTFEGTRMRVTRE